ncbi:MAG: hypothetical protein ACOCQQ_03535 [Candidatus Nanoarchaeia archaeon]
MKRKGQAAMEFLTTYGWAFLVIIVVVGALYAFGVFDTSSKLPSGCQLDTLLDCSGGYLVDAEENTVSLNIKNGDISGIEIINLTISEQSSSDQCVSENIVGTQEIASGQAKDLVFEFSNLQDCGIVSDVKQVLDIKISYTKGSSSIVNTATGTLVVEVQ